MLHFRKIKFLQFILITAIFLISLNFVIKLSINSYDQKNDRINDEYIMEVSAQRINRLFDILLEKEKQYNSVMKDLGLILFENLINEKGDSTLGKFPNEVKKFLKITNNRVRVNNKFIRFLHNISYFYTFKQPRIEIKKFKVVSVITCF